MIRSLTAATLGLLLFTESGAAQDWRSERAQPGPDVCSASFFIETERDAEYGPRCERRLMRRLRGAPFEVAREGDRVMVWRRDSLVVLHCTDRDRGVAFAMTEGGDEWACGIIDRMKEALWLR